MPLACWQQSSPVLPDGETHPQFFENWENLNVFGAKISENFPKGKLGKFEGVGSTLGTGKKGEFPPSEQLPKLKSCQSQKENGYFRLMREFFIDLETEVSECFRSISKKKK